MAQAGGKNPEGIPKMFEAAKNILAKLWNKKTSAQILYGGFCFT
jgi:hypothetical protein